MKNTAKLIWSTGLNHEVSRSTRNLYPNPHSLEIAPEHHRADALSNESGHLALVLAQNLMRAGPQLAVCHRSRYAWVMGAAMITEKDAVG